jgi:hypothetical protein
MLKIEIPTPCHQNWTGMTPNTLGKFCGSCEKTVIDFTKMTDDEVKNFFINKKEEKICGRFLNTQLQRVTIELPHQILYMPMPSWKKFLAAALLVFSTTLFSCDTVIMGKAAPPSVLPVTIPLIDTNKTIIDTSQQNHQLMGDTVASYPEKPCKKTPEIDVKNSSIPNYKDVDGIHNLSNDDINGSRMGEAVLYIDTIKPIIKNNDEIMGKVAYPVLPKKVKTKSTKRNVVMGAPSEL